MTEQQWDILEVAAVVVGLLVIVRTFTQRPRAIPFAVLCFAHVMTWWGPGWPLCVALAILSPVLTVVYIEALRSWDRHV